MADYYPPYDGPPREKKKKKAPPKPKRKPKKGYGCGGMAKHNKGGKVTTYCSHLHDKASMQKKGK